jgi:D-sedoheptulose 7-phosphate isomerase
MQNRIEAIIDQSIEQHQRLGACSAQIAQAAELMIKALEQGGKILFAGNGGSAADAQHLAAELVNRFLLNRRPLAGLALTTDTSNLTSIANDFSFEEIFAKQVEALGRPGDVFFGISTSGSSANIVRAVASAQQAGLVTIGLTGSQGRLSEVCDHCICVPGDYTPRVQECHILIGHILCELIEERLCA